MARYLLDTNILMGIVRGSAFVQEADAELSFLKPPNISLICTVSRGEIFSMALRRTWGKNKWAVLEEALRKIPFVDISHEKIIRRYAEIQCYTQGWDTKRPLPSGMSAKNIGQNDLWIAATASVLEAILVTTDGDFDPLNGVFLKRILITPSATNR